jgi:hypothetical protein
MAYPRAEEMNAPRDLRRIGPYTLAVLVFIVHCATNGQYGYFRDELYFMACGRELAFGYVDQPPLIALVARISELLSSGSVWWFRMPAALAHTGLVIATGRMALRFGATAIGATLASLAIVVSPTFLVSGHLLTMNAFEPLFWLGTGFCVVALIDGAGPRVWLMLGALLGFGMLNKHSMLFYAFVLCAAWVFVPERRAIVLRGLMMAVGVAVLIVLPHAIWQAANGFPMLELLENGRKYKNADTSILDFVAGQFLEQNPVNAAVWISGLYFLARSKYRAIAVAHGLLFLVFVLMKAKVYYFAAAYPIVYAAGGALLGKYLWPSRALGVGMAAVGTLAAMLALPVLPPARLVELQNKLGFTPPRLEKQRYSDLPQHLSDQFGWVEMVEAIALAYGALSPEEKARTVIFLDNYGEAGAVDFFGPKHGLPRAYSGHNHYFLWGPPPDEKNVVLAVGTGLEDLQKVFQDVRQVGQTPANKYAIPDETESPIYLCRGPKMPWSKIWPRAKSYQ